MSIATILQQIRGEQPSATPDDIRESFGDYHNVLYWLAAFLTEDETLSDTCIVDACTVAETQTQAFHEWLVHWAARATVRCLLQTQRARIAELAPKYQESAPADVKCPPLSLEYFQLVIKRSEEIHARLDVLCRFVLIMRGIAQAPCEEIAGQLGIRQSAVERAYCAAFEALKLTYDQARHDADLLMQVESENRSPYQLPEI
jgi:DNA-directed RNA polymerase specialized sigma24 family protein